jgi:alpha-glucosidase (family GH31 glycosyl hydrolase)
MPDTIPLLPGEHWWGGCVHDGASMPFPAGFTRKLIDQRGNQVQPLLVSDRGRWVWCEEPFAFSVGAEALSVDGGAATVQTGAPGGGLRGACLDASRRFFPPAGRIPDPRLFTRPQYNTWTELIYDQSEAGVLRYAEAIVANRFPTGVLMIDDGWQLGIGQWEFHPGRFRDPAGMVRRLHELGFAVMLWVCPHLSPDTALYREARAKRWLLAGADGEPVIRRWWNGASAVWDLTHPEAAAALRGQLQALQRDYGVDGFKFDAGDFGYYRADDRAAVPGHGPHHSEAWARFGLDWPLNEYRACWKLGGQPLAQRLRDKAHSWDAEGVGGCIPDALAQGLVGYAFNCPDLIGGGEYTYFLPGATTLSPELFVRHAQLAALFPMMQFGAGPWRLLPGGHTDLCRSMAELHVAHGERILALAHQAAATGEPILRHLAYVDPEGGFAGVRDQFLLGDDLLVAPVVEPGRSERTVRFPAGRWLGDDGSLVEGRCERTVSAPLGRLPFWLRQG